MAGNVKCILRPCFALSVQAWTGVGTKNGDVPALRVETVWCRQHACTKAEMCCFFATEETGSGDPRPWPQGGGGGTGGMGGGYGSGLSAWLTDRPERPPLNPDPAFLSVMGVMRPGRQGGESRARVVGRRVGVEVQAHELQSLLNTDLDEPYLLKPTMNNRKACIQPFATIHCR